MFALSDIERLVTFDRAGVGHLSRALIRVIALQHSAGTGRSRRSHVHGSQAFSPYPRLCSTLVPCRAVSLHLLDCPPSPPFFNNGLAQIRGWMTTRKAVMDVDIHTMSYIQ
jgi:hypothetical protein